MKVLALALLLLLSGCSSLGHWSQALGGHLGVLSAARPVEQVLADPQTPPPLAARLRLAQALRRFAAERLALPDNASYTRYADLGRSAVLWNVVAAPELGLNLKTWCYPVMGCAGYRGYFDLAAAQAEAKRLADAGWDVQVLPVPAYSSLGWSNWLGGDPLLNTFINYPEGELAAMLFHELAHQRVYIADDTAFNESYASAVELLGARAWLADRPQALAAFEAGRAQRARFQALARRTRDSLAAVYASTQPDEAKRRAKAEILAALRRETLPGYEHWLAGANNASFAILAAYADGVPAFERLFDRVGRDWPRLHAEVARIGALPAAERAAILASLQGGPHDPHPAPRPPQ